MLKAGLIAGVGMFVVVLVLSAGLTPFCALCVPLVAGILAGYLTGVFEKNPQNVVGRGASAGAIAGAIALLAQMVASLINAAVLQSPENQLNRLMGIEPTAAGTVWAVQLGLACIVGLVNIALTAGLGAVGGVIWKSTGGKTAAPPAAPSGT
jgi:ABC-type uncharacterized transport system permease subunit